MKLNWLLNSASVASPWLQTLHWRVNSSSKLLCTSRGFEQLTEPVSGDSSSWKILKRAAQPYGQQRFFRELEQLQMQQVVIVFETYKRRM
jgi:hypothetical protein